MRACVLHTVGQIRVPGLSGAFGASALPVTETVTSTSATFSVATPPVPFFQRISLPMASASTDHNVDLEAQRGVQHSSRASSVLFGFSYHRC